jgi:hypothetical protein
MPLIPTQFCLDDLLVPSLFMFVIPVVRVKSSVFWVGNPSHINESSIYNWTKIWIKIHINKYLIFNIDNL